MTYFFDNFRFYIKQCKDIFGDKFDFELLKQAITDTNTNYGGYDYQGSRVVFVNGNIDPWHALGFYGKPPNPNTQTIFIEGIKYYLLSLYLCEIIY